MAGTFLWGADLLGCQSCREGGCYSELDSGEQLTGSNLLSMSVWPFLGVVFVSVLFTIIVIVKPVEFWRKCDRALGYILLFFYSLPSLLFPTVKLLFSF